MRPILFANNETDFTTNGIGRLDCISCKVVEERNGMYELEAEIPITGLHASDIEMLSIIGVVPHEGGNVQAFVVYKITKPINGRFMVYARHISYRLSDIPCTPFSIESSPQACAQALAGLKSHAVETCPFNFNTDVTTGNPYIQKTPASIRQRLGGVEGSILDQFGGEYEWDNFNISLLKQRGRLANTTGITLRYGKNITDINQEEEIANTVTGVVPFWIDTDGNNLVMLPEVAIYSQNADNYPYHLTQTLDLSSEFQEKPTQAQLRTVAQMYVTKDGFGEPKVSIKVSFVDLWKSEEYKDIAPLEQVQLCDEITVDFEKLGIKALAKVVKTDYDVLKERYNSIEVGSIRTTLAQAVTDRDKDIDTAFVQQLTRVSTAIADATAWLTSANGYVIAIKNTDGSWKELVFSDRANPYDPNAKILRINNNGIGFSTGGMSGIYKNAWTIDGVLNADFVKAGILGDVANKNFWNMVTGEFSLQAGATVGGKTVDTIAQEKANAAQAAAESAAAAALSAAVDDLQGQIDGNITSWFYSYEPTTSNAPASTWTTVDDKINHIGDLFYDSTTGYCYRWQIKADAADPAHPTANDFEWVRISDEDISEALSKAQTAQDTADGKRRVFISQPVPPYDIGDLWTTGASGDILTCTTAKTESGVYDASDWEKLNKYTDDTAVNALDASLGPQGVFNRLTDNGNIPGIFLTDDPQNPGKKMLIVNANYIATGILADKAGKFSLNMETGALTMNSGMFKGQINVNNNFLVDSSGNMTAKSGTIGNLTLGNGALYAYGTVNFATNRNITADKRTRISVKVAHFIPSRIGVASNFQLIFQYYVITSYSRDMYVRLQYRSGSNWYNVESYYLSYSQYSIATINFSTSISYTSDTSYRVVVDFLAGSSSYRQRLSCSLYTNNVVKTAVSADGFVGKLSSNMADIGGIHFQSNTISSGSGDVLYDVQDGFSLSDTDLSIYDMGTPLLIYSQYVMPHNYVGLLANGNVTAYRDNDNYVVIEYDGYVTYMKNGTSHSSIPWSGSDRRIKEDITALDMEMSKALIDATDVYKFRYKNDEGHHYGVMAQDVREVLDSLGEYDSQLEYETGDTERPGSINVHYQEYVPLLINYVKDLRSEVESLKDEIATLKELIKKG